MPSVETSIWLALRARIATLSLTPAVDIAWPASTYAPDKKPYIAVGRASIEPRRVLVGKGSHDRTGTLTLSYVRRIGQDAAVYIEQAGVIAAHFEEHTRMRHGDVCVRISAKPHVVDGYRDEGWWRTPVNIRWQTFA